jgi:LacI family transcriptional regulator
VADSPAATAEVYREVAGTGRVDGIILADVKPEDDRISLLQEIGIPFIAFGRTMQYADLAYPFVDVDGAAGIQAVMDHLYKRGHQRIAYLSSPFNTFYALDRYRGFSQSLAERGLEVDPRLVIHELQQPEEVAAAVTQLLALPTLEQPTAFVTDGDRLAVGVLTALEHRGIPVGPAQGQVAVTGFDDLAFAAFLRPPLTTVRQPIAAACETLLSLLIAQIRSKETAALVATEPGVVRLGPEQILLEPQLVIRGSA